MVIKAPAYEQLPAPNTFACKEEGFFLNNQDCQMFWYCQHVDGFKEEETIIGQLMKTNFINEDEIERRNPFKGVRLYKCPEGYIYDASIEFCHHPSKYNENIQEISTIP